MRPEKSHELKPYDAVKAVYRDDKFALGNPLIDTMTFFNGDEFQAKVLSSNEAYLKEKLGRTYDILLQNDPDLVRTHDFLEIQLMATRLIPDLVYPFPRVVRLYRDIATALREKYSKTPWRAGPTDNDRHKVIKGLLLCGFNGIGKTMASDAALGQIQQVIVHSKFQNVVFSQIQVVWLRVNIGGTDTPKALCSKFFKALDDVLRNKLNIESDYYKRYGGLTKQRMLTQMRILVEQYKIGVLVFDEIQRINQYAGSDRDSIVALLMELVDEVNTKVILCGTPPSETVLQDPACSGRYEFWVWPTCDPVDWKNYVNWLWQQPLYFNKKPLTLQLFKSITKVSAMIPRVACGIYVKSLERSITKDIPITSKLLEKVCETEFMQMLPFLQAVRSKDWDTISKYRNGFDINSILSQSSLGSQPMPQKAVKKYIHEKFTDCLTNPSTYFYGEKKADGSSGCGG